VSLAARKQTLKSSKSAQRTRDSAGDGRSLQANQAGTGVLRLLDHLLVESSWLRLVPESEQAMADKLQIPKSSLREAVIALIRIGCLQRTDKGVMRDTLTVDRLVPLYAMRLRIELLALRKILDLKPSKRQGLASDLWMFWKRQADVVESEDDFVTWLEAGMAFHTELVRRSELSDLSNLLHNLLVQVRVGSFFERDTVEARRKASAEHKQYILLVEQGYASNWHELVESHIRDSFDAALSAVARGGSQVTDELWHDVIDLARCDPVAEQRLTHINRHDESLDREASEAVA